MTVIENPVGLNADSTLDEAIFMTLGYVSACWDENRVFEDRKASQAGYALKNWVENFYEG